MRRHNSEIKSAFFNFRVRIFRRISRGAEMLAFEISDTEFQFGPVSLGADICLSIEGDGSEFQLTHCFVENKPAEPWVTERMRAWIRKDLAQPGLHSRVRRAFLEREIAARDEASANYSDHLRHERRLREAA